MKLFYRKLLKVFWKSKTYRIVQQMVDLEIAEEEEFGMHFEEFGVRCA